MTPIPLNNAGKVLRVCNCLPQGYYVVAEPGNVRTIDVHDLETECNRKAGTSLQEHITLFLLAVSAGIL